MVSIVEKTMPPKHIERAASIALLAGLTVFGVNVGLNSIASSEFNEQVQLNTGESILSLTSNHSVVQTFPDISNNASKPLSIRFTFRKAEDGVEVSAVNNDGSPYFMNEDSHQEATEISCQTARHLENMGPVSLNGVWGSLAHYTNEGYLNDLLEEKKETALFFQDEFCQGINTVKDGIDLG